MMAIQSMDDIKRTSEGITLPYIDVRQSVMQKIYKRKEEKKMFRGKKLLIVLVSFTFFICSVGFTVAKVWDLKGPGNSPYQYQLINENPLVSVQSEAAQSEWEKVNPGEALAVLRTKDNPSHRIGITYKPLTIKSLDELQQKVGNRFKSPSNIPDGYSFIEGQISSGINESIRNEMIKESEKSNNDVITRIISITNNIQYYSLLYKNQEKEITVTLHFDWKGQEFYEINKGQKAIKTIINDYEAIFTEQNGRSEIKWLESTTDSNILYSIGCPDGNATKDELVKVAESLK